MTSIYQEMETHGVPEDVIDKIARNVHKENYSEVLNDMNKNYIFYAFHNLYKQSYDDIEYYIDDWVDWTTVVVKLDETRFVLYHNFFDWPCVEKIIAEGSLEGNTFTFYRFAYKQFSPKENTITDVNKYPFKDLHTIPFYYLMEIMGIENTNEYHYKQHKKCKTWENWDSIKEWFEELIENS